jgi:hypothetical protein
VRSGGRIDLCRVTDRPDSTGSGSAVRVKTTVCIDPTLLRAVRAAGARTGKKPSAIVEEALRRYLGFELLRRAPPCASQEPDEDEALDLAYRELREGRR